MLLHIHDQLTRSEMSFLNASWMWFYPLLNGLIIGFKRPVFISDVYPYKNLTCYLIQTLHSQFLSWVSHFVAFGFCDVDDTIVNRKGMRGPHLISFHRFVGMIIPLIIIVSPLIKTFFFFQDNVGYQF